ncbi:MAG TPA: MFS transporter, partial [Turneriella sp.]|nr:MFS transporter [Turneriella sp.]
LLLSATEEFAGKERAGSATGLLMLTGNAGGVVVGVTMDLVKSNPKDWTNAIYLLLAAVAASLFLAFFVEESFHAKES